MEPDLGGAGGEPRNTVEVLTILSTPGVMTVTVGSVSVTYAAPVGLYVKTVPLRIGSVSAQLAPDCCAPVTKLSSPFKVVRAPLVQDEQYYAVSTTV